MYENFQFDSSFDTVLQIAEVFVRVRKKFVLQRSQTIVRNKFSYSESGITSTCICAWISYATKFRRFRTFSKIKMYEIHQIKSRMKISTITVFIRNKLNIKDQSKTE